jgi:hypothetical protein
MLTPSVVVDQDPDGTLCSGMPAKFTALPVNEGTTPVYSWKKNGLPVATGLSYTDNSLNNGDKITCTLTSNVGCATVNTVTSVVHIVNVGLSNYPLVSITANPGTELQSGQTVTFTASITDGGGNPYIHWQKNSVNIPDAHATTYTTNSLLPGDTITCIVISKYACAIPNLAKSNKMGINAPTGINNSYLGTGLTLYPNPNNGLFTIKGNMNPASAIQLQIIDVVGQTLYTEKIPTGSLQINKTIDIKNMVAPGVYLLQMQSSNERKVISFSVGK